MTAVVGAMVIHLLLRSSGFSAGQVDAIPGTLLLVSESKMATKKAPLMLELKVN